MKGSMEEAWDHLWSSLDKAAGACLEMQALHREFSEKMEAGKPLKGEMAAQWGALWETIKNASFEAISAQAALRDFEACLQEEVAKAEEEEEAPADPPADEMAEALLYAREFTLLGTLSRIRAAALAAGGLDLHDRALAAIALLETNSLEGLEARHILKFWGRRVKI